MFLLQTHGGYGVVPEISLIAFEWQDAGLWQIRLGSLTTGAYWQTAMPGAPDGLDQLLSDTHVTLRKDTRGDVAGIWSPVSAGPLVVGMLRDDPGRPNDISQSPSQTLYPTPSRPTAETTPSAPA